MCRQQKTWKSAKIMCRQRKTWKSANIICAGNEKLGAKKEPDPDPAPYLFLTFEMKRLEIRY